MENDNLSIDIDFAPPDFRKIVEGLRIYIPALKKIKREMIKDIFEEKGCEKYFENPQSEELILKKNIRSLIRDESNSKLKDKIKKLNKYVQKFEIYQNGLGYNNLIYIATVIGDLIERKNRKTENYLALLIEEPEAHLHPQLQNVLFNYLKNIERQNIQVLITSHSPTITAKTDMDTVIVMSNNYDVDQLSLKKIEFEDEKDKNYLKRFLDVTKSQLFFAQGVIFVEGISEAILLQLFSETLGIDLEKNGVEIVNVGGVAFKPFAQLFISSQENKRLKIRGAILSDNDESNGEPSKRAQKLKNMECENLKIYLARQTFEYELFLLNEDLLTKIFRMLHSKTNLQGTTTEEKAVDLLNKLRSNKDKGDFSHHLAKELIGNNEAKNEFKVPEYIQKCIKWVVGIED